MDADRSESLVLLRRRARLILVHLRSPDAALASAAADRCRRLRSFAGVPLDELRAPGRVRLKHALTVIAVERGHASWVALKRAHTTVDLPMYERAMVVFLNRWFADYGEARSSLAADGGFLLPFRQQFFITEAGGIRTLGLDPDDPDWARIGFDWVRPADAAAHARLAARRRAELR